MTVMTDMTIRQFRQMMNLVVTSLTKAQVKQGRQWALRKSKGGYQRIVKLCPNNESVAYISNQTLVFEKTLRFPWKGCMDWDQRKKYFEITEFESLLHNFWNYVFMGGSDVSESKKIVTKKCYII